MSASLTALIIDDEPLARQELQYLLDAAGDVQVLAQGTNGIEAVDLIRTHKPDVIFLDVQMPGLDGFAVLKKVMAHDKKGRLPQVVFATAYDQYAVRAFEVNAVDYLLKPFDKARLVKTLEKVRLRVAAGGEGAGGSSLSSGLDAAAEAKLDALLRMVEQRAPGATPARSGKVVVRAQNRLLLVDQKDVCFASIEGGTISVRAHRSFVVNIQHIREVVPWFKSSYQLRMDDRKQTEIPVSRSQTKRLRELFNL
jgi:two-component system response regulator LytT